MADLVLTANSPYILVVEDDESWWMLLPVRWCTGCGEKRPVTLLPGDAHRCAACGLLWDPSEASC